MYQSTTTSERLQQPSCERTESTKLTSSQVASPAKMCHAPALEKALKTAMGKLLAPACGESTQGLLTNLGQDGLWQRTYGVYCQPLLISDREATSELFWQTWPTWGMMRSGRVTVLKPLARRTKGKECLLWPTAVASDGAQGAVIGKDDTFYTTSTGMPRKVNRNGTDGSVGLGRLVQMWPIPNVSDRHGANLNTGHDIGRNYLRAEVVLAEQNWPTPATRDYKGGRKPETLMKAGRNETNSLNDAINSTIGKTGALNADWTELLMNLPIGWTDIDCEEPQPWPGWPAPMNAAQNWATPNTMDMLPPKRGEALARNKAKGGCRNLREDVDQVNEKCQYPYEPPRVVVGQKNRAKRLKALGNGCVPAQVYSIFKAIMEIEGANK